jgi:hypothetical protein
MNASKRWTDDEDDELLKRIEVMNIQKVAILHKRTPHAITERLKKIAHDFYCDGMPSDDILKTTRISNIQMKNIIDKHFTI